VRAKYILKKEVNKMATETEKNTRSGEGVKEEPEVCEVCGKNPASIGIPQMDESMLYLCDSCYAERGIEGEEIEGVEEDLE
jgi:hypothetical protein